MSRDRYQRGIYLRTGQEKSTDPLVALFYDLGKRYVPIGHLYDLVEHARNCSRRDPHTFTDGDLARVAKRLARRVRQ